MRSVGCLYGKKAEKGLKLRTINVHQLKMDFNKISGWASIIGIPLAVLLSWVFFELGQEEQEPIFLEDYQARTVIVDKENTSQAPITILDEESNPVVGNVISTKFYFWNNGKKPILFDEDVLERADTGEKEILVSVYSSEEETRILKYDCPVKVNQDYTGFTVSQVYKNAVSIRFNVMRRSEGVTCSIVFEGDTFSLLTIQGSLLENPQGFSQGSSFSKLKWAVVKENFNESLRDILLLFFSICFYTEPWIL